MTPPPRKTRTIDLPPLPKELANTISDETVASLVRIVRVANVIAATLDIGVAQSTYRVLQALRDGKALDELVTDLEHAAQE
jgi:hypothetical protein